ncbi:MAG: alpha-E domain-containing protein, partial [Pseudomonadales bacterium]|nr:alpha-E domain-containing protein [Pseudomonadales bacterium]
EAFAKRFTRVDERNVVKFLLQDEPASIRASVQRARENARTSREIMPTEAWQRINELHLYLKRNADKGIKREGRHRLLTDIIDLCNQLTGLLAGGMSEDTAYSFIKIGRNLERADMTTRIVDAGCLHLLNPEQADILEYDSILWMNVLQSLTAYQMYRQHVQDRVNGEDVVDFLIKNPRFPRAANHCIRQVLECCEQLPNNDNALRSIGHIQRVINNSDVISLLNEEKLHDFIDDVQMDLADIHEQVSGSWFGHEVPADDDSQPATGRQLMKLA